ncbi:alpha/beta fold hydrolase [Hyphococcus luteus]|uniref:alpha/beta fold hydrolase n=1 Tax=Hyphococcus luteus TaxID=2058213 RepID=UPI0013FDD9BF|nr:alpha/beta hydrolase [Marinicaulis flavus]
MAKETTFVLVHGAWWGGDWFWRGVADRLRAEGHRVFTPMLTGLGSRAHLKDCGVDLSLHILDIVKLIEWEALTDIVLVGHSYAGMVVSGAAEKLPEGTIRSIVFLDAFLPENGEALADIASNFKDLAGDHDPVPPPVFFAGDNEALKAILEKRGSPQSRACFEEPVVLTGARERIAIKTYVLAQGPVFLPFYEKAKADPGWRTETIDCAHFPMLEAPEETAEILLRAME